jgi:hypothetical protein
MRIEIGNIISAWVLVTLDGERQGYAICADEEAGTLVRYKTDEFGVRHDNGQPLTEVLHGAVKIGLVDDAPEWVRKEYEYLRGLEAARGD